MILERYWENKDGSGQIKRPRSYLKQWSLTICHRSHFRQVAFQTTTKNYFKLSVSSPQIRGIKARLLLRARNRSRTPRGHCRTSKCIWCLDKVTDQRSGGTNIGHRMCHHSPLKPKWNLMSQDSLR